MESLLPRKLISLTCVALVAMSHAVSAQNTSAVNATAFDFLNRNICPASSGRAGTDLAFSDPSSLTIFSNPASLAFSEKELDAAVAYSLWQPDGLKTNVYDAGLTFRPYDKLGVEYSYRNAAFARLGYNYASDKAPVPSFASVGIGFRIRSVRIDASYILPEKESPQKNTFSAGVGIWF